MTDSDQDLDRFHMDRALALALEGWGRVAPNPLVGAVVVSGERVTGEGAHTHFGGAHAEVMALTAATGMTSGGTLYVTLEPCAHHGQTPPCTEAILQAGLQRVVFGCRDPDPRATGGAGVLSAAGVDVTGGVCGLEAARLNAPFVWDRLGHGPWVSLKLGLSLDGRIAARPGVRTEITGPESAEYVHALRAGHDAILVGGRTACIDDPLLTVRLASAPRVPPTRVVLDPDLHLPTGARLVGSVDEAPLLVVCREGAPAGRRRELESRGAQVLAVPGDRGGLSLSAVLHELGTRGIRSILVEGGGRLAAAWLAQRLVRRQYLIYAPIVLGPEGVPAIGADGAWKSGEWDVVRRESFGGDTLIVMEDRRAADAIMEVV